MFNIGDLVILDEEFLQHYNNRFFRNYIGLVTRKEKRFVSVYWTRTKDVHIYSVDSGTLRKAY